MGKLTSSGHDEVGLVESVDNIGNWRFRVGSYCRARVTRKIVWKPVDLSDDTSSES